MQGYRIYDAEGIGVTISASTGGPGGKGVGLYLIREDEKLNSIKINKYINIFEEGDYLANKSFNKIEYKDKVEFTYYSLFAGIGGMTMGLEPLGGKCLGAWEYDPTEKRQYAQEAHKLLHPHITVHGDVTEIIPEELEDFDVLAFTPPCQSFSIAGLKKGFEDTRGTLTFDALQVAKIKQPKVLFMENVKGMLSHDKGNTMSVICHAINEIGYYVDFTILNSKFFDVAQNRERLYLVAVRKDLIEQQDWELGKGTTVLHKVKKKLKEEGLYTYNFGWPKQTEVRTRLRDFLEDSVDERYYLSEDKTAALVAQIEANKFRCSKVEDVTCINPRKVDGSQTLQHDRTYTTDGCMTTLQAQMGGRFNILEDSPTNKKNVERDTTKGVGTDSEITLKCVGNVNPSGKGINGNVYSIEAGLSPTLTTNKGEGVKFLEDSPIIIDVSQMRGDGANIRTYEDISPTITARDYKEPRLVGQVEVTKTKYNIRKLTVRECFRLQATPEPYIDILLENFSNSRGYKFAGNGLTINVIRSLGEKIITYLNK